MDCSIDPVFFVYNVKPAEVASITKAIPKASAEGLVPAGSCSGVVSFDCDGNGNGDGDGVGDDMIEGRRE
jgi:hypothetical protein